MPTTLSTAAIHEKRGLYREPNVERAVAETNLTTGSTTAYTIFQTHRHAVARATIHASAIGTNSTLTVTVLTGPSTAAVTANVQTSSGLAAVTVASTDAVQYVFGGLNRYTRVQVSEAGGSTESTGVFVDLELE